VSSSAAAKPFGVHLRRSARIDRAQAHDWWVEQHGPIAPSRLEAELELAFALLADNPELGYASPWRGREVLKYRLASDFFLVYTVRPRRREVVILRILAASRLHG
jgi:plasmid stabilization system protein ParE